MSFLLTSCALHELVTGYEGVVYDSSTGRPMEGVYVMAEYVERGAAIFGGHSFTWCAKTAGMYTGADGKFSLPASHRTTRLHPIKVGYTEDQVKTFAARAARGGKVDGPPYDFFMMPQVPGSPRQSELVDCARAEKASDIMANLEYLEILGEENRKYEGDSRTVNSTIRRLREFAGGSVRQEPDIH